MNAMKKCMKGMAVALFTLLIVFGIREEAYANTYSVDGNTVTYEVTDNTSTYVDLGMPSTTGYLPVEIAEDGSCTSYRFLLKNNSSKTINVTGYFGTPSNVSVKINAATSYGLEKELTIGGSKVYTVFSQRPVKPGSSIWMENYIDTERGNGSYGYDGYVGSFNLVGRFKVTPGKETPVTLNNKPNLSALKCSANMVLINVEWNGNTYTEGATKAIVYMGNKEIKTLTSNGNAKQSFVYSKKGAGSGKFKVKLVDASDASKSQTSKAVKTVKNTKVIRNITKLPSISEYDKNYAGFTACSVSYSGKTLCIKGIAANTYSSTKKCSVEAKVFTPGNTLYTSATKTISIKPGVHWYTYKIKTKDVVDLVNNSVRVEIR